MKIAIILLLSLLIKLYLADEDDYSFLKKFENGRLVSLDEGECPNLKDDPIVREMIAKRNERKAMASLSPSALTSDKTTTTETAAVTTDSTSAAMTSKVSSGASSKTVLASSTAETTTKGPCDISFNGTCYWTHVEAGWNVNFARAEEICSNKSSTPAHFPNEEVFNNMVEYLRSKMHSSGWHSVRVWTGVIFDPSTRNVIHPSGETYVKWHPGYPGTGFSFKTKTHVVLYLSPEPSYKWQGLVNDSPQWKGHGVVCQSIE